MAKQSILVAKHELSYRIEGKRAIVAPGTELTAQLRKKMGLKDDEIVRLKDTGAVADLDIRISDAEEGAELAAALEQATKAAAVAAAETVRADAAEGKVQELETRVAELEAAAKPAEPAKVKA